MEIVQIASANPILMFMVMLSDNNQLGMKLILRYGMRRIMMFQSTKKPLCAACVVGDTNVSVHVCLRSQPMSDISVKQLTSLPPIKIGDTLKIDGNTYLVKDMVQSYDHVNHIITMDTFLTLIVSGDNN